MCWSHWMLLDDGGPQRRGLSHLRHDAARSCYVRAVRPRLPLWIAACLWPEMRPCHMYEAEATITSSAESTRLVMRRSCVLGDKQPESMKVVP